MKKIMVAIMSFLLLAIGLLAYETDNSPSEAKYYDNAKVIRIKNVEGEGFVQRSYEEGFEEATPNLPVFEKDTVGTTAGRLGIYLGRLNYMRLDTDTQVDMLSIPQLRETNLVARVTKGSIYLDIANLDKEKSIEIQTPDCGIFLLDNGIYRINVDENSITEVFVIEGIAEVAGQDNSRNVRENQKIVMSRGRLEERPYYFYASEKDDFDRWNDMQNREQGYARYGTSRYLQSGYEDYEYEMSRAGRWMYMSAFNSYVWIPYFSNAEWMPYSNGRWIYNPFYGYVWTSYDNCGWFTHHYGRWHWDYVNGWYWIPAYHWSPAWVSWFWDNDYYGWCPLSWWNRPIVIINNHWDRNFNYRRGIPRHSRSNIIIRKSQLTAANARRVALSKNKLVENRDRLITFRGTAPVERPSIAKVTVINARGKSMLYKQNSIVSNEKYKISNDAAQKSHTGAVKTTIYKYNPPDNATNKYSPRIYRSKDTEKGESRSGGYVRSKTSDKSSTTTRARSSDSKGSRDKSGSTAGSRGNAASSSKSSSTTGSSGSAAKKKKDGEAYAALLRSENSAGYKSHAVGSADRANTYSTRNNGTDRHATRAYASRNVAQSNPVTASPSATVSRFSNGGKTTTRNQYFSKYGYASRTSSAINQAPVHKRSTAQVFSTASSSRRSYSRAHAASRIPRNTYSTGSSRQSRYNSQVSRANHYSRSHSSVSAHSSGRNTVRSTPHSSSSAAKASHKKNH
ncbi:MAG: hypothetical protein JXI33_02750 [Candidatus Aminicenantes bacterium]|nr:hypothetical protein [Candidatus Aminicenantes bacterium]